MVLLTSSAISVALSGGIICTFTFLLFLSGYVLQQQTVRSLQDALRNPPEKLTFPSPTLPSQFRTDGNGLPRIVAAEGGQISLSNPGAHRTVIATGDEGTLQELWNHYLMGPESVQTSDSQKDGVDPVDNTVLEDESVVDQTTELFASRESLAYIFIMPNTYHLCSAILFAKKHQNSTHLAKQPHMVFIYPASWDVSDKQSDMAAMDLLREMQDDFGVTLHPVAISRVWAGISVEQQLLSELQRYRWPYDRAMYLGSPGMVVDSYILDKALISSNTKSSWTLLHPNPKSYEASHPPLLLWASGRGLLYPRPDMKTLTAQATTAHDNRRADISMANTGARNAAYVLFSERELRQGLPEEAIHGGLFQRYERDRRDACSGTNLYDM